jgi:hypothetical protein
MMQPFRSVRSGALVAGALTLALAGQGMSPSRAAACGGFFCQSVPMDQAGENILFSVEGDGSLTAYVQILYQGEADRFAWILPLPSVPELEVGTDAIFRGLGSATQPYFTLRQDVRGTCRSEPSCWYGDDLNASEGAGGRASDASASADASAPSPGVTVVLREVVGPYDAVVLSGRSAEELQTWLRDNGYDIPDASVPILQDYATMGYYFVAVRLLSDRETTEIQPLVLRYREGQPCVPLRLTAIATVPDMPITAYFLADAPAVPTNYSLAEPTFDEAELWTGERGYVSYVSDLVDTLGGRAFVTDYAGTVPSVYLELPSIDHLRAATTPREVVQQLVGLGYQGDAQLLSILQRVLPPPAGAEPRSFYNCLAQSWCSDYAGYVPDGWSADAMVTAIDEAITQPRRRAQALLGAHPTLTRLFTTMSAEEMTFDPTFRIDPGIDPTSNVHEAVEQIDCGPEYFYWTAPSRWILPSGRVVPRREGVAYPGTDEEFCMDRDSGDFSPWTPVDRLRQTSERRALRIGGGGRCAASPGRADPGLPVVLAALALLARGHSSSRKRPKSLRS